MGGREASCPSWNSLRAPRLREESPDPELLRRALDQLAVEVAGDAVGFHLDLHITPIAECQAALGSCLQPSDWPGSVFDDMPAVAVGADVEPAPLASPVNMVVEQDQKTMPMPPWRPPVLMFVFS